LLAIFTITIFLGAALLFVVQPMIAKMLLPLLGGSPAVWNTCMVFFQAALLAGYAYAHWSVRILGPRRQALMHSILVLAPFAVLPIALRGGEPPPDGSPIPWLLLALAATIGLPFVVAATGGPLLQRWFAATGHRAAGDPYFLYAASNAGSLIALLGYPLLIEPLTTLGQQRWLWSGGYAAFALLTIGCGLVVLRSSAAVAAAPVPAVPPATGREVRDITDAESLWRQRLLWIGLAFIPSSLMLGVTQYISTDIAAMPLMWVVPLSIYLVTFILAFASRQFISIRWLSRVLPLLVLVVGAAFLSRTMGPLFVLIAVHLLMFAAAALLCHMRLAQSRPHTSRLTEFYLLIAVGGVLGGIFNALVAPLVFNSIAEYPIAIALACLVRVPVSTWWSTRDRMVRLLADFGAPAVILGLAVYGGDLSIPVSQWLQVTPRSVWLVIGVGLPLLGTLLLVRRRMGFALAMAAILTAPLVTGTATDGRVFAERTFYGVHGIRHQGPFINLIHNNTVHGLQARDLDEPGGPEDHRRRGIPLGYYALRGPIGQVVEEFYQTELFDRVGIVGLGAGTLAAYGMPGQHFTFHEIDPAMVRIAEAYFTYLHDTRARWDVVLGDGRKTLERVPDGEYGLLVLDAFSSDAVPVHLLTVEAVELYMSKLRPGGLLAFHISNRYLAIWPVLERIAGELDLAVIHQVDRLDEETSRRTGIFTSEWVVMARRPVDFGVLQNDPRWTRSVPGRRGPLWTDDYSNILSVFAP
jgi:hypothetical protein